jgi:hypothetical protein
MFNPLNSFRGTRTQAPKIGASPTACCRLIVEWPTQFLAQHECDLVWENDDMIGRIKTVAFVALIVATFTGTPEIGSAQRFECCSRLTLQERAKSRVCKNNRSAVKNFDQSPTANTFKASDTRKCPIPGLSSKSGFVAGLSNRTASASLSPQGAQSVTIFNNKGVKLAGCVKRPGLPNGRETFDCCRGGEGQFSIARRALPYAIYQVQTSSGVRCYASRNFCDQRGGRETEIVAFRVTSDAAYRTAKQLKQPACGKFNSRRPIKNRAPTPTPTPTPTATPTVTPA